MSDLSAERSLVSSMTDCPNPVCAGQVAEGGSGVCEVCGVAYHPCVVCHHLRMEGGGCLHCGTSSELEQLIIQASDGSLVSPAPVLATPNTFSREAQYLLNAYRSALVKRLDQPSWAVLELARLAVLGGQGNLLTLRDRLDDTIGRASADLQPILVVLRNECCDYLLGLELDRIARVKKADTEAAWDEWRKLLMLFLENWRLDYALRLAESEIFTAALYTEQVAHVRENIRRGFAEQWGDTIPFFKTVSTWEVITASQKAHCYTNLAAIALNFMRHADEAEQYLDTATQLAPQNPWVLQMRSNFFRVRKDFDKARKEAETLLSFYPTLYHGYDQMSELALAEDNLAEAERWLEEGINRVPGSSSLLLSLMYLFSKAELFPTRGSQITDLARTAVAIEPADEPTILSSLGERYTANRQYDVAYRIFDALIARYPDNIKPREYRTSALIEEERFEEAKTEIDSILRLAPEATTGAWLEVRYSHQQGEYQQALDRVREILKTHPEMDVDGNDWVAYLSFKMEHYGEAEESATFAFERDASHSAGRGTILDLSREHKEKYRPEQAQQLLDLIRRVEGEPFEAEYQNESGHIDYWLEAYPAAAEHYRRAVAAKPQTAIYHSNLAQALEHAKTAGLHLAEIDEAVTALERAAELAPDEMSYKERKAQLETARQRLARYGELAAKASPVVTPIHVELGKDLIPADTSLTGWSLFSEHIPQMRERIKARFGIQSLPGVRVRGNDGLEFNAYQILIHELPAARGKFDTLPVPSPETVYIAHLERVILRHICEFFGMHEAMLLVSAWLGGQGKTLDETFAAWDQRVRLRYVLQSLLQEQVPLTRPEQILECIRETGLEAPEQCIDAIRAGRRDLLPGADSPERYRKVPEAWEVLLAALPKAPEKALGVEVPIFAAHDLLTHVRRWMPDHPESIILVVQNPALRKPLRKMIDVEYPDTMVVAQDEITEASSVP